MANEKLKPPEPDLTIPLLISLSGVGGLFLLSSIGKKQPWYKRLWNCIKKL